VFQDELQYFNKTPLRGHVREWPPNLAEVNGPATYCGTSRIASNSQSA
jgi:hypothetical protein